MPRIYLPARSRTVGENHSGLMRSVGISGRPETLCVFWLLWVEQTKRRVLSASFLHYFHPAYVWDPSSAFLSLTVGT